MTQGFPARTPTSRRRSLHALIAFACVCAVSLALVSASTTAVAASAKARAEISVDNLDPMVVMPRAEVNASGFVRNTGGEVLTGGKVRLRLSQSRLNSRAELAAAAAGKTASANGVVVAEQALPQRLARGADFRFRISADLAAGSLAREFGVYLLTIEVVAGFRAGFGRVGVQRTFLPWVPAKADFKPAGFALLWPLLSAPTRRADGTFVDDSLLTEMTAFGRLEQLVAAGESLSTQLPLTWVVDPALLEDAGAMSGGYRVTAPDGILGDGTGAAAAKAWLGRLQVAAAGQPVVSLPYADPDVVALRRHGLLGDVEAARLRGEEITRRTLGLTPTTDLAWPAEGFVDRSTLNGLRGRGFTSIVLDARAVEPELNLTYTPTGRADIDTANGTTTALLYDPVLMRTLGVPETASPLLSAQRFLAETAMITAELPSAGVDRKILIAPPRGWSPSPELLTRLVDVILGAPWLTGVPLQGLAAAPPPEIDRQALRYPAGSRKRELPAAYLAAIRSMHQSIEVFSAVLTEQPNPLISRFDAAVHRAESSWWRGRNERVNRLVEERRELARQRNLVRVLPGNYTFGSRTGEIPLTISNGLNQEVLVDVQLRPRTLLMEIGEVPQQRIGPRSKIQINVPAQARARGVVLVDTNLRTPTGATYDNPVELRIQVTQYGTLALYITLGAAGVLMLASIGRLTLRAARHRRRSEPLDAA